MKSVLKKRYNYSKVASDHFFQLIGFEFRI